MEGQSLFVETRQRIYSRQFRQVQELFRAGNEILHTGSVPLGWTVHSKKKPPEEWRRAITR